jgi:hypothetical protein
MRDTLERNVDRLLRIYPTGMRTDDLRADLLAATSEGRGWPARREIRAVAVQGLRARGRGNSTSASQSWLQYLVDSLAWAVALTLGAILRHWRHLPRSDMYYWLIPGAAVTCVLAARRSRWFCAWSGGLVLLLSAQLASVVSREYRIWRGTTMIVPRLPRVVLGLYLLISTILVFRLISRSLRHAKVSCVAFGILLAIGAGGVRVTASAATGPIRGASGMYLHVLGLGFAVVSLMGGLGAACVLGHRHRTRPTLRWSLLAALLLGGLASTGGWGGSLYAAIVVATCSGHLRTRARLRSSHWSRGCLS